MSVFENYVYTQIPNLRGKMMLDGGILVVAPQWSNKTLNGLSYFTRLLVWMMFLSSSCFQDSTMFDGLFHALSTMCVVSCLISMMYYTP